MCGGPTSTPATSADWANCRRGPYTTLDILLRGASGGEAVAVGLRDAAGREPRVSVGDLLPGGITTEWRWVQIPLAAFPAPLDLANLTSLSLTFYNSYAPQQGRVYIKELRLTALAAPIVIDHFDDGNAQINARGLGHWTANPDATLTASHAAGDAQMPTGYALRLDYDVRPGGYALWGSDLGGATAPADARLTFWVKGENLGLLPNLYLTDGSQRARVALGDFVQPGRAWQFVAIPLSAFTAQGLNPNDLRAFQVAFEWQTGAGTLWLDAIQIGTPGAPQAGRRVLYLNGLDSRPLALHLPGGEGWQITSDSLWLTAPRYRPRPGQPDRLERAVWVGAGAIHRSSHGPPGDRRGRDGHRQPDRDPDDHSEDQVILPAGSVLGQHTVVRRSSTPETRGIRTGGAR